MSQRMYTQAFKMEIPKLVYTDYKLKSRRFFRKLRRFLGWD